MRGRTFAALGLVAFCMLLASGRMNTFDGSSQLSQAVHFCATGHIAAQRPISSEYSGKDFNQHARTFYDSNGIGGTLLMLPAACLATLHGAADPHSLNELPSIAKAGASMTFALVGAFAAVFVFLALCELISMKRAWWWALTFVLTTGMVAYIKGTWDVLPAATAVAALTWIAFRSRLERDPPFRSLIYATLAIGAATLARYTLLPFLFIGAVGAFWPSIRRLSLRELVIAGYVLTLSVVPSFAWNQIRTGQFWTPAEANPMFGHPHLTFSYLLSVCGLFFGLHEGLLFYAPFCLIGYVVALLAIRTTRGTDRIVWVAGLFMAVLYVIVVALVHAWEVFGWGPRYLVPLIPTLFVIGVVAIERRVVPRAIGYALAGFGLLTQFPLIFADWHAVVAVTGRDSRAPDPIIGLWRSMFEGLAHGYGFGQVSDPRALQVPDSWWWHAVAHHFPHVAGPLVLVLAAILIIWGTTKRLATASKPGLRGLTRANPV